MPETNDELEIVFDSEVSEPITEENAKTLKLEANLMFLDDENLLENRILRSRCRLVGLGTVPLLSDEGDPLGAVNLTIQNKAVVGEFFLDYATPHRLDIENKAKPYWPRLEGYYSHTESNLSMGISRGLIFKVSSVVLSKMPCVDSRVKPF